MAKLSGKAGGGNIGDMVQSIYDPNNVVGDAFARANAFGTTSVKIDNITWN